MKFNYIPFFIILLLLLLPDTHCKAQQDNAYYFYTLQEIQTIKKSAVTTWGKSIVDKLQATINERLLHPMEVPLLEGGHVHHYFCPVHNTQFVFDWDSPQAHYCKACGKAWSGVERYDWAWVNFVHNENQKFLVANMYMFLITDKKEYAGNITRLLLDYAGKYPDYKEHDRDRKMTSAYSGRLFSQSLDEAVWAIDAARAYLVASSEMTEAEKKKISDGYLRICASMLINRYDKGNWQVWHNGAIASLGVALKNDSIVDVALNKPISGYHAMLNRNVYNDGWWNEGSVVYHFYPLRSLLLTADAVRCRNINLYDGKLYHMLMAPVNMLYPDLTFPSQNDGWYGITLTAQANLYEIVSLRYAKEPLFKELLAQCYRKVQRNSPEALINGSTLPVQDKPLGLKSHLFPDLGVALLRSKQNTVVLKYGPDGGIHGHPDKLTLSIHNGKQEILPDLGTTAYGVPDCALWYRRTFSHSTVTVDGSDQRNSCGKLVYFKPSSRGGELYTKADSAYNGVEMSRKVNLTNNLLKDKFTCTSSQEHTYDYVLMLTHPVCLGGTPDSLVVKGYERISGVTQKAMNGSFGFTTPQAVVSIRVNAAKGFQVISGVAPGIPPTGTKEGADIYPLIIRVSDKNMDIEATWKLTSVR